MTAALYFIAGLLLAFIVSDAVLAVRIYRMFPKQSVRPWPGAGWWMNWKSMGILRSHRIRLQSVNALAKTFPVNTAHRDETRSFVAAMRKLSDVAPKPEVKS